LNYPPGAIFPEEAGKIGISTNGSGRQNLSTVFLLQGLVSKISTAGFPGPSNATSHSIENAGNEEFRLEFHSGLL
jgi:hypothetical protein